MPYLGREGQFGVRNRFQYLASNGDTSVSGEDANGITMTFSDGLYIDVYLNGVKLKAGEDYNTTTANTVAGISAMNANDEVEVIAYDAFSAADTVSAADGGTFSGNVTFNGDISVGDDLTLGSDSAIINIGADSDVTLTHVADTGVTLASGTNDTTLQIDSNAADADAAPYIILNRTSDSPADSDKGGIIQSHMENDNNQQFVASSLSTQATDVSDGTEDAKIAIATMVNGTLTTGLTVADGGITLPEGAMSQSILQVIANSSSISGVGTTSTSYADITNATVNITPQSSSNKILVIWSGYAHYSLVASTNVIYYHEILRDSTSIKTSYYADADGSGGQQGTQAGNAIVLDSPGTTDEVTYKVRHKVSNGSSTGTTGGAGDQIIVIEIGA